MAADTMVDFRLYVADTLPNSVRAVANLEAFCREHLPGRHRIEVLNVFEHPERALADRILLTPHLTIAQGRRKQVLFGDLTDRAALCRAVELEAERS